MTACRSPRPRPCCSTSPSSWSSTRSSQRDCPHLLYPLASCALLTTVCMYISLLLFLSLAIFYSLSHFVLFASEVVNSIFFPFIFFFHVFPLYSFTFSMVLYSIGNLISSLPSPSSHLSCHPPLPQSSPPPSCSPLNSLSHHPFILPPLSIHLLCIPPNIHLIIVTGCAAIGMLGLCCPTPDGAMLACCDALLGGEKRMQEEWRSLIYLDHAGRLN